MTIHGVTVDMSSQRVIKENREIALTLKEYEILALLIQNRNVALSGETIYQCLHE